MKGGAIFFSNNDNINEINTNKINEYISIENNILKQNIADYYGGAIYSEYNTINLIKFENNSIINNNAGIFGGGIYISNTNSINNTLFNIFRNSSIENNNVGPYIDNYSSIPTYVLLNNIINDNLNVISGDYIPLIFTLQDKFYNNIFDISNYYSVVTLKLLLSKKDEEKNTINNNKNNNYKVLGNVCNFVNGQCEMKNLQIYASPGHYILKPNIENYKYNITFKFNDIKIQIMQCNDDQIKMTDKDGSPYCENPICRDSCPVGITAKCVLPSHEINSNNKKQNICHCYSGWKGENCNEKIFVDFRKQGIIKDTGFNNNLLFSIGTMLYFIRNELGIANNFENIKSNDKGLDKNSILPNSDTYNNNNIIIIISNVNGNGNDNDNENGSSSYYNANTNNNCINIKNEKDNKGIEDKIKESKILETSNKTLFSQKSSQSFIYFNKFKPEYISNINITNLSPEQEHKIKEILKLKIYMRNIRNEGNNNYNYFQIVTNKKCIIHKSYKCRCNLNLDENLIEQIIHHYILLYKYSSKLFMVDNGKISYLNIENKLSNIN
ncbi:hypothetical protein PIROE2DRAFT_13142 [Piromyces sp. E2]|nr:hypothetical protein PIROE2DRAFT_13142 [Piromyces sp. E2]|eukprot:OUM60981.1 hypothetical protein PIROE2DRAFT_13142 [Piromyces sp. E2]